MNLFFSSTKGIRPKIIVVTLAFSLLFLSPPCSLFSQSIDTAEYSKLIGQIKKNKLPFDTALFRLKKAINRVKGSGYDVLLARLYISKGDIFYLGKSDFENALINYRWAYNILKNKNSSYYYTVIDRMADVFYYMDKPDSIYAYAKEGLERAKEEENEIAVGKMKNQLGVYYSNKSEKAQALRNYLAALKIFQKAKQKPLTAKVMVNIGILYLDMGDYQAAKSYFLKVLQYGEKVKDDDYISVAVNNLGAVYSNEKKYDSALVYFKRSLEYDRKRGDEFEIAVSMLNVASTQLQLKKYEEGRKLFWKVIGISRKNKYVKLLSYVYNNLADLYRDTLAPYYNVDSSIFYYTELLRLARQGENLENLSAAYYGLQLMYGRKGDYSTALDYADKYIDVSDSLFNIKKVKQLNEIKEKYETEKKEKEYLLLQQKNERVRLNFILATGLGLFFIVLLTVLLRIRVLKNRQLKQQKQFIDNLLQYDNSYIIVISGSGTPTFQSPSVKRDLGEFDKENLFDSIHPDDRDEVLKIIENVKKGLVIRVPFACRLFDKSGAVRYVTGVISNKLNDPLLKGVLINFWDYTAQKKYEHELEESEKKYRSIFEAFPDVFFRLDNKGVISEISPSVEKITGLKREEIIGKKANDLFPDVSDREEAEKLFHEKGKLDDFTLKVRNVDGKIIIGSVTVRILTDENGNPAGAEGVFRDITDRVKQENELREANETKDKLFSIIAHDLVGPIGMQKNILDLVLTDIDSMTKEEIINFLETIKPSLDATFFMIENLLSWARIMRNTIQPSINSNNLYKIIAQAFDFLATQAKNKGINLVFEGDKNQNACFDVNILDIVLRNLITNAIKFSPKGETVTVKVTQKDDAVRVSVIDRGVGIPPDMLENLKKEKHTPQSRIGTSHEKGTGLGLVVVKEFLALMGSKLNVMSEENKGSVFYFDLPVE